MQAQFNPLIIFIEIQKVRIIHLTSHDKENCTCISRTCVYVVFDQQDFKVGVISPGRQLLSTILCYLDDCKVAVVINRALSSTYTYRIMIKLAVKKSVNYYLDPKIPPEVLARARFSH